MTSEAKPLVQPPFVRERDIVKRYGISRGTQNRLRKKGLLPAGIRLGPRTVIFSEPEILEALAALAGKRN
ncbi:MULTISPECIES: AlpA family phage regulatory protein [Ruegeria]|uniref:helix-turn-helix transcriptional regulator n=1 Tax=Ruegeria sp. HKCCD7318 TaxID=2683014 RepID=UPI0014807962|nr:AlpA family phage regulatory protein [Ruegeria sp. HKCCD7318]